MTAVFNGPIFNALVFDGPGALPPPSSLIGLGLADPGAARLISVLIADPASYQTDPGAARLIAVAVADPSSYQTDPDAASLIVP